MTRGYDHVVATIFTRIIIGEIPGTFVWRDDTCVAFMSINPIAPGHVLVVPIAEVDHWVDLPVATNEHIMRVAHAIGTAQRSVIECERIGLIVAGYEVPHTHLHVIPTRNMADVSFANAATSVDRDELEAAADRIRAELLRRGHQEAMRT